MAEREEILRLLGAFEWFRGFVAAHNSQVPWQIANLITGYEERAAACDSDRNGEAAETVGLSPEGESAGRQASP